MCASVCVYSVKNTKTFQVNKVENGRFLSRSKFFFGALRNAVFQLSEFSIFLEQKFSFLAQPFTFHCFGLILQSVTSSLSFVANHQSGTGSRQRSLLMNIFPVFFQQLNKGQPLC